MSSEVLRADYLQIWISDFKILNEKKLWLSQHQQKALICKVFGSWDQPKDKGTLINDVSMHSSALMILEDLLEKTGELP